MVGGIAKPRLFREFKPDARALAVIARCGTLRDDVLLRALAGELETEGIQIVESTLYLQDIVPAPGVLVARATRRPRSGRTSASASAPPRSSASSTSARAWSCAAARWWPSRASRAPMRPSGAPASW